MSGQFARACLALVAVLAGAGAYAQREPAQIGARPAAERPFLMPVEDVFSIAGRGTVVTGRVESGSVRTGDEVEIVGIHETRKVRIAGVEMFRKLLDSAKAGDNVGLLLTGVTRNQVERGQVLARPGSIKACSRFEANIAATAGYAKPLTGSRQLYFRTTDIGGTIEVPRRWRKSGGTIKARINLTAPIAMAPGLAFAVRESGRTVGTGTMIGCRDE